MVFAVPDISDVLEWKKSVQKAFKKHSKSVEKALKKRSKPFGSVLELKKKFWSGNNRSGVLFCLEFGKIDRFCLWCGNFHDQEDPGIYNTYIFIYLFI